MSGIGGCRSHIACHPALGLSAAGEQWEARAVWCGWSHLGSGGAQSDLTSQLIIHPQSINWRVTKSLYDGFGNLKL